MEKQNLPPEEEKPNVYKTGSTKPARKHFGLVATLLAVVIFLGGIASAMGFLNIRLFQKINEKEKKSVPMIFSDGNPEDQISSPPTIQEDVHAEVTLDINECPPAVDNIPEEGALPLQQIYEKNIPSVVSVVATMKTGEEKTGSGVVLSHDGFLVSSTFLVNHAEKIIVHTTDGRKLDAEIIGSDMITNLSVLHVDANNLIPAEFGNSEEVQVGDTAVSIGDPLGPELRGTMADGIISAVTENIYVGGRDLTLLQTSAALSSDSTGGPLINCYGQVIGITTNKIGGYPQAKAREGLGFAVPSTLVKDIVEQLMSKGHVTGRPYLGFYGETITPLYQQLYLLPEGILVSQVDKKGPAYQAGLQPGDVVMKLDDQRITDTETLTSQIIRYQAGDLVTLTIFREDKIHEISLTIRQAE